jgi:hypothetical protein
MTRLMVAAVDPKLADAAAVAVTLLGAAAGSSECAGRRCRLQQQQRRAQNAAGCALWVLFPLARVTC